MWFKSLGEIGLLQVGSRFPSIPDSIGVNSQTPPKKPSIPMPSKKQKVSGDLQDQSIEQLNDVTAVSGVSLREEEKQLISGANEDGQVSEASRRVVQEKERMILQKTPLKKKLAEIMAKFGLKNVNSDVERCLSLCVEERMRRLIGTLIRLSKQRVDAEKPRHLNVITSDVRQQIMTMNQTATEGERKQAEAEKIQKVNEPEGDSTVDKDEEKDDRRVKRLKTIKANKEEDDQMRRTATNVAVRSAVGGDDMLSKWKLMAEKARQKRGGEAEVTGSEVTKASATSEPLSTFGKTGKGIQDFEKRSGAIASRTRKFERNQATVTVARSISVKDVISALEREPQMSKSTLIHRLYERTQSDAPTQ